MELYCFSAISWVHLRLLAGNLTEGPQGRTSANIMLNILVVDDEPVVADSLVEILRMFGYTAHSLYGGEAAVKRATENPYDVLISDVVMNGMSGIDAAIAIRQFLPKCKVLLVSGNNRTADLLKSASEKGHEFEILAKPAHPSAILDRLKAMSVAN
jgi:CheY-like chemotaxis protein